MAKKKALTVDHANRKIKIDYSVPLTEAEKAYKEDCLAAGYTVIMKAHRKSSEKGKIKNRDYYRNNLSTAQMKDFEKLVSEKNYSKAAQWANKKINESAKEADSAPSEK